MIKKTGYHFATCNKLINAGMLIKVSNTTKRQSGNIHLMEAYNTFEAVSLRAVWF